MSKWTFEAIMAEATKYKNRSEFHAGKRAAYNAARDAGMLDHLFPTVQQVRARLQVTPEQLASIKPVNAPKRTINPWDELPVSVQMKINQYIIENLETLEQFERDKADKLWLEEYGQIAESYFAHAGQMFLDAQGEQ